MLIIKDEYSVISAYIPLPVIDHNKRTNTTNMEVNDILTSAANLEHVESMAWE